MESTSQGCCATYSLCSLLIITLDVHLDSECLKMLPILDYYCWSRIFKWILELIDAIIRFTCNIFIRKKSPWIFGVRLGNNSKFTQVVKLRFNQWTCQKGSLQKNVKRFTHFLSVKTFFKILHISCCLIENIFSWSIFYLETNTVKGVKYCKIVF